MTILDRPPRDWVRPGAVRLSSRRAVLQRQHWLCADTGEMLEPGSIHFDHRPAVWERQFDTVAQDTVPSFHDPDFLDALTIAAHDRRTHGPGGERRIATVGSDSGRRAKSARLQAKTRGHEATMAAKVFGPTGNEPPPPRFRLPSRSFPKVQRPMPSRPFPGRG